MEDTNVEPLLPVSRRLPPLDMPGLPVAFDDAPDTPNLDPHVDPQEVTPLSLAGSLPTPPPQTAPLTEPDAEPVASNHVSSPSVLPPGMPDADTWAPGAPLMKDMDSFTDGTAKGSFDFSLDGSTTGALEAPEPAPSVAFSPNNPCRSIEMWRDDVLHSTDDSPALTPLPATPLPATPLRTRVLKRQLSSAFDDAPGEAESRAVRRRSMLRRWPSTYELHGSRGCTPEPYEQRLSPVPMTPSPEPQVAQGSPGSHITRPSSAPPLL